VGKKRKVGHIGVAKDWWDTFRNVFLGEILDEDPKPVNVNKRSEENYKEVHQILSTAIYQFDILKAAIQTVSIRMFQALFSSTYNQVH